MRCGALCPLVLKLLVRHGQFLLHRRFQRLTSHECIHQLANGIHAIPIDEVLRGSTGREVRGC